VVVADPSPLLDAGAEASLAPALKRLSGRAEALLVRVPAIDPLLPVTSDVDVLAVGAADDFLPERIFPAGREAGARLIDVVWLPRSRLDDPGQLAAAGLIAHRAVGSELVYDRTGSVCERLAAVRSRFHERAIRERRISGFLDMGYFTVREIGVTWDFPALALFWLHMAHAACLAALVDGLGGLCANVYTRPVDSLQALEETTGMALEEPFVSALHLDVDPLPLIGRLRCMHGIIAARFPEPPWPAAMRQMTRFEYRYFSSAEELEWRLGVAGEMVDRGSLPAAVFYLRFWAYVLARLPMVHQRSREGVDVSFVRPSRAVRPELERLCPEVLADLSAVLGGDRELNRDDLSRSLDHLLNLRQRTLALLAARGFQLGHLRQWRPYEPARMSPPPGPGQNGAKESSHG
jgi:hypothetical protein